MGEGKERKGKKKPRAVRISLTLNYVRDTQAANAEMFNPLLVFLSWLGRLDAGQFSLAAGNVVGMADSCLPACLQSLPVQAAVQLHRAIVCPLRLLPPFSLHSPPCKAFPAIS